MAKQPHDDDMNFDFDDMEPASHHEATKRKTRADHSHPAIPDDDDEMDFDFDNSTAESEMHNPNRHHQHVDNSGLSFDDDMPEPPVRRTSSQTHQHDNQEFDDVNEHDEYDNTHHNSEHNSNNSHSHNEHDIDDIDVEHENEHDDEVLSDQPVERKKNILGSYVIPGVGIVFVLGVVYALASSAGFIGSQPTRTASSNSELAVTGSPRLPSLPATTAQTAPVVPKTTNTLPGLPPTNVTTNTTPVVPTANNSNTGMHLPTSPVNTTPLVPTSVPSTPVQTAVLPNTTGLVTPTLPSDARTPVVTTAAVTPTVPVSVPVETDVSKLVSNLRDMNTKIQSVQERTDSIRSDLGKLPQIESKITDVDNNLSSMKQRADALEQRITALESSKRTSASTGMLVETSGINSRVSNNAARSSVGGYTLKAVSRDAAMVVAPNGQMQIVRLGQMLPGAGIAKELQKEGNAWLLITSQGIIRPQQ